MAGDRFQLTVVEAVAAISITVGAFLFACFAVVMYIPTNPLTPDLDPMLRLTIAQTLPEGWAFFTRSPREPYFKIYRREKGTWISTFRGPSGEPSNAFGLDRSVRAQGLEYGVVREALASHIEKCDIDWRTCAARTHNVPVIVNRELSPMLCGRLLFLEQKQIPWNWAHFKHVTEPASLLVADVRCVSTR